MRSAKPTTVPACTTDTGSGLSEVNAIREDVLLFAEDLEVFAEEELILPFRDRHVMMTTFQAHLPSGSWVDLRLTRVLHDS
jgi:hypothetical protein